MPQQTIFDQIDAEAKGGAIPPPPTNQPTGTIFDQIHEEEQARQNNQVNPLRDRTPGQVAWDQTMNVGKGLAQSITGIPSAIAGIGGIAYDALTGNAMGATQKVLDTGKALLQPYAPIAKTIMGSPPPPESPEWAEGAQGAGSQLGGLLLSEGLSKGVPAAIKGIPSKPRALANLNTIMASAKDIPLDLTEANQIIDRSMEISSRGGSPLPKPQSDLRAAQAKGPVTFEAGKDFASSASSQSVEEKAAIKGQMKSQVAQFAKAMRAANRAAAEQVGMGDLYDKFVKEYSRASTIADKAAIAKEVLVKAAILATAGHLAYKLYEK